MKVITYSTMLLAIGTGMVAAPALAGTASSSLSVNASVTANCTVSTTAVDFGSIDTLNSTATDSTGSLSVTCTNGTPWSASAAAGSGTGATAASRKMSSGLNTLEYSLYTNPERSSVWGDGTLSTAAITGSGTGLVQTSTIYARVPGGQTSAPAGTYADTVAITVSY